MRCDLHVHSWYSGRADLPVLGHVGRECYSDPEDVYEAATRRGMDLVTLTDHDGIEGALRLAHRPNTFVSEEVTVVLPGERLLHVNVFDITESQHEAVQARRFAAGPRGLASIVFAIIVLQEGVPGGELIALVVACTVMLSLVLHGITANPMSRWIARVDSGGS